MMQIEDDPQIVNTVFKEMREECAGRQTHNLEFRKKALKSLLEGFEKMQPDFDEALKKDLGLNSFMSNFLSHGLIKAEVSDLLNNLDKWAQPTKVETCLAVGVASSSLQMEPLGLALVLSAWNYPFYTALGPVGAAIAAGNSVILKPSELAPHCSNALAKLFEKYLDPRYYRCLEGKVKVAQRITQQPFDIICFTGSTTTGRLVAIEAAKNLTPCLLQLGGKCPVIVDPSANIDSAVKRILFGKFVNAGQTCVGVDHVYVHASIAEKFKKELLKKAKQFYGGNDIRNGEFSQIINEGHVERLKSYIYENHGGKILYEGSISKEDRFISPFIIQDPNNSSQLMNEEIFGPILPIKTYENDTELMKEINSRAKPLVVYLFSSNDKAVKKYKAGTSSGAFVVNDVVVQMLNSHLPFGGVGGSGYGRYHGQAGFKSFSNPKSICLTKPINSYPLSNRFPPYTDSSRRMMTFLLKIGSTTYESLGRKFKWTVIIAAGLGWMFYGGDLPRAHL